ncbi:hypothetical protein DEO72_LG3g2201 [Vigna unguiculata]|nr:hypothetical protein DEO72_LG3g2201 [Vigna unguiculata]
MSSKRQRKCSSEAGNKGKKTKVVKNADQVLVWLVNVLNLMLMTSRTVSNMPFKVLDNLDNLSDYNWAESVHSFFISALNHGCKVVQEKINTRSLNLAGYVVVVQIVFGWALSAEEKNNPIVQNVVNIEDQYIVKNDGIQGVSHSKEQVDLEEKFEQHERIILDMKEQIKKMHDKFFDALKPDSCAAKGNDVYGEEGCPSHQK